MREIGFWASAVTGDGIDSLAEAVSRRLAETTDEVDLVIPFDRGDVVALVHEIGNVATTDHTDAGTHITAQVPSSELHRFVDFAAD